jgi:hypothetical protein
MQRLFRIGRFALQGKRCTVNQRRSRPQIGRVDKSKCGGRKRQRNQDQNSAMLKRVILAGGVLGAAVGVPYVATEWSKLKASVTGQSANEAAGGFKQTTPSAGHSLAQQPYVPEVDPRTGMPTSSQETPVVDMSEAFRFNVTQSWVMSKWPRVSAGLPDPTYHGLRVPLISGMRDDDLAGALSYYFTQSQKCAKITFSGTTGDPRRLASFMKDKFGFKPFASNQPGVERYEIRWNGKSHSELIIRPAAVVRSANPLARYEVQLVVMDPSVR